jgi:hypothetical protein
MKSLLEVVVFGAGLFSLSFIIIFPRVKTLLNDGQVISPG